MVKLKAIVLLGLSVLTIAAVLILVLTNMGNDWEVHVFWKTYLVRRGTMLVLAGSLGCVLLWLWRTCIPAGLRAAKAFRKAEAAKESADMLKKLQSDHQGGSDTPKPPSAGS